MVRRFSLPTYLSDALTQTVVRLRRGFNRSLAAWLSIAALLILAAAQPSASALEFPMTSHLTIPDAVELSVQPTSTLALFSQLKTGVSVSSNELALVSLASSQVELARTATGAQMAAKQIMASEYKWNLRQYGCLKTLWNHESHWNYKAHNYNSGAHGIAQAMPADKMEVIAMDWRTNPVTQIKWGLHYIDIRYSTPCNALSHFNYRGSY
jgi:hypothetical protein